MEEYIESAFEIESPTEIVSAAEFIAKLVEDLAECYPTITIVIDEIPYEVLDDYELIMEQLKKHYFSQDTVFEGCIHTYAGNTTLVITILMI